MELSSKSLLRTSAQEDKRVVAIGELGLDFFKNENKTQQIDALIPQMELAYELKLPVIIHCRDAANEMIEICSDCLLYTSPSPRDKTVSRMPSSA